MMMMILVAFVFVAIVAAVGVVVYVQFKKTDPSRVDTSVQGDIATAQEFLPFEDIKEGMICMGGHSYRAVIECSSTNYNLKTSGEKEIIELAFQRFVNSLTFPITFYIQTKVIDNSKMLELLQEEITESLEVFPDLREYGETYFNGMLDLNGHVGNNKQKRKYIIVPFDDAILLSDLNDQEKYEYAAKEMITRQSMLIEGLSSVGVKARALDTKGLAELVFSSYHKDNYTHVENVVNGEFLTLLTESENNRMEALPSDARLDWILYEAQMRIQTELISEDMPDFIKANFDKCIAELSRLRDQTSGYYKQHAEDFLNGSNEEYSSDHELTLQKRS